MICKMHAIVVCNDSVLLFVILFDAFVMQSFLRVDKGLSQDYLPLST